MSIAVLITAVFQVLAGLVTMVLVTKLCLLARNSLTKRRIIERLVTLEGYTLESNGALRMPDGAQLVLKSSTISVWFDVYWLGSDTDVMASGTATADSAMVALLEKLMRQNRTLVERARERRIASDDYRARLVIAASR